MAGNVAASQQGDVREGSRRGSALIPQGAARHSPGWLRQERGRREAGSADGERGGVGGGGREGERGEAGGDLGNSAQTWPTGVTAAGSRRGGRDEVEGRCGSE